MGNADPPRRGPRLLDLLALVASFGLAAVLIRAFYPREGSTAPLAPAFVTVAYAWLGLAMGGPLVLLLDRRARPRTPGVDASPTYTWAETAWLLIGGYWIGLAMLVVPSRLPINPLLNLLPIVAVLSLRLVGRRAFPSDSRPGWTHAAAVVVLVTWPLAWLAMIALGKAMG